jgi:8-oxo-dGTP diphosphatase
LHVKEKMALKTVRVVAALILNQDKVLATQRRYGEFKDGWEFPGGKIEPGETPEQAIKREIREELATDIRVEQPLTTVEYDYPTFHLSMECFICKVEQGNLTLLEHEAAKWLSYDELDSVDWLPADRIVVRELRKYLNKWRCKRKSPEAQRKKYLFLLKWCRMKIKTHGSLLLKWMSLVWPIIAEANVSFSF